jgi:hypothetical protein
MNDRIRRSDAAPRLREHRGEWEYFRSGTALESAAALPEPAPQDPGGARRSDSAQARHAQHAPDRRWTSFCRRRARDPGPGGGGGGPADRGTDDAARSHASVCHHRPGADRGDAPDRGLPSSPPRPDGRARLYEPAGPDDRGGLRCRSRRGASHRRTRGRALRGHNPALPGRSAGTGRAEASRKEARAPENLALGGSRRRPVRRQRSHRHAAFEHPPRATPAHRARSGTRRTCRSA